jgi:16S rRNA (cytosine1402-N4)-methyltransferase
VESFCHKPVLIEEVLAALEPKAGENYLDGTVGGGGHAEGILNVSAPDGRLYGCDRDGTAVEWAKRRLARFTGRYEIRRGVFADLPDWVPQHSCAGGLVDLGTSSPQLDEASRGFSFQQEGPLDMRMDDRQALTAMELVNVEPREELARMFAELGGERQAGRIASAIERERNTSPLRTTTQLAALVERVMPRRGARIHPATRVFQALRMAVNDELGNLVRGLGAIWILLRPGGRLAVITFHSLEDRIVKEFGREKVRDYTFPGEVDVPELREPVAPQAKWLSRKAILPSDTEIRHNPRSRSAQLRVLEKLT